MAPKIAVPGVSSPRTFDQPPHTRSWPSGHSGSIRSVITNPLPASQSYWDRTPYVEVDDETGQVSYVEHHRTLGDWVSLLAGTGFVITDLLEPEWPEDHDRVWGGWSKVRGLLTPGTAIFGATLR